MIPLEGRKIVLVGGAGFIGHHLALTLKERGADVHVLDSLQINNLEAFQKSEEDIPNRDQYIRILKERLDLLEKAGVPLHVQDARDYHELSKKLGEIRPQVIVQLAAVSHAGKSNKDPFSTFDHSLRTLENALDNTRADYLEHFIYFSSSMVYGHFPAGFVDEETICHPLGIYGALKYAGEKIVDAYEQVFKVPVTTIRPSALYGERCVSRRVGQIFIENAMEKLDVTISGDGSDSLDFTYVGDLVQGVIKCIENENARGEIFNLTYGASRTIAQMADILKEYFPEVTINYVPKDALTPDRGTLSVEKAKRLIGYDPQWPLEKGFPKYIEWYKSTW